MVELPDEDPVQLSQFLRVKQLAGPDGPCVMIQGRKHLEDNWEDHVLLHTNEALKMLRALDEIYPGRTE